MDKQKRWVILGFLGFGLLAAWLSGEALKAILYYSRQFFPTVRDIEFLGNNLTLANLIGLVVTVLVGIRLWNNEEINDSAHQVVEEISKMTWPTGKDTQTATIVVVVMTIVMSTILWFFDQLWGWLSILIYGLQKST